METIQIPVAPPVTGDRSHVYCIAERRLVERADSQGRADRVGIAFLVRIAMFFMMMYWHGIGNQNLSNEAYKTTPAAYAAKVDNDRNLYGPQEARSRTCARRPAATSTDGPRLHVVADARTRKRRD